QLHLPSNICSLNVRAELDFWKLPEDLICECCWMNYHQGLKTMGVVNTICKAFHSLYDDPRARAALSWAGKIWLTLDRPSYNWFSKVSLKQCQLS
ncbi:potassium voltage-gated channel protein Shaw, partial [Elysia marginata]